MKINDIYTQNTEENKENMRTGQEEEAFRQYYEEKAAGGQLSLEDYREKIDKLVSRLRQSAGYGGSDLVIFLTDEAYEAMRMDPAYEAWVLDQIRSECSGPPGAGSVGFLFFTGDKKGFVKQVSSYRDRKRLEELKEERRRRLKKLRKLQLEAYYEKKRLQRLYFEELAKYRCAVRKYEMDKVMEEYLENDKGIPQITVRTPGPQPRPKKSPYAAALRSLYL